jgi:hypothetical protein
MSQDYLMRAQGWVLFNNVIPASLLARLRDDLMIIYEKRRAVQIKNGIGDVMSGTCHHLLGENSSMDEFLALLPLDDFIKEFFAGNYILNSFGAFINQPHDTAYVSKIHRDVRTFAGEFRLLLNMLVMLDDFTLENGATYVLSGSHRLAEKPAEELFYSNADRMVGRAGDILMFDSNVWHAAGENTSKHIRRGLTLTFSRPFFKQQIDFPRFLGEDYIKNSSAAVRQILGYNARVPASVDEFYQPVENRFYKPGQG